MNPFTLVVDIDQPGTIRWRLPFFAATVAMAEEQAPKLLNRSFTSFCRAHLFYGEVLTNDHYIKTWPYIREGRL